MRRFFVDGQHQTGDEIALKPDDSKHFAKVLRGEVGDEIQIVAGENVFSARVTNTHGDVLAKLTSKIDTFSEAPIDLYLLQGIAKGERMDLVIQKAVELGAKAIIPVAFERCVVQLKGEKAADKQKRWQKIAESAAKQCGRQKITEIMSVSTLEQALAILDKLENNRRKEYVPTSEYTIEHIMPQTLSDDWKSDLGADANRIHETYVHTIGNLTLTGYNSEYQNKRFSDKVDCTDKAGNAIGYRHTPIRISSYLTTVSKWGEAEILARAEMLSDELIAIWKYPKKD